MHVCTDQVVQPGKYVQAGGLFIFRLEELKKRPTRPENEGIGRGTDTTLLDFPQRFWSTAVTETATAPIKNSLDRRRRPAVYPALQAVRVPSGAADVPKPLRTLSEGFLT